MKYPTAEEIARNDGRLQSSYDIEPDGCWNWRKALTTAGYGHFFMGRYYQAHRIVFIRYRGPVPDDRQLDHLCRNRRCVNPDHLEVVTQSENIRRSPRTRMNRERIALTFELADKGYSTREIARLLTVDHSTISRVLNGLLYPEYAPARKEAA